MEESRIRACKVEIEAWIRRRIGAYFPDLGANDVSADMRWHADGHDSEVCEIVIRMGRATTRELILKLHRPARMGLDDGLERARGCARREYEALSFLWREFSRQSDRFTVPRPLDHVPEWAALVMEKCQGVRLDRALRWARLVRGRSQRERLCQHVAACGEWLGLFHRITERPADPSEVYRRIERDFKGQLAVCCSLGLNPRLIQRLASVFQRGTAAAFAGHHKVVGHHCDFGPYNVFLAPGRIAVIDFEGLQDGIIYDDMCYFLAMIEDMSFYHLGPELVRRMKDSFLHGYLRHGTLSHEELELFMLPAMAKIAATSPTLHRADGWINRWKRRQQLGFLTRWLDQRAG